MIQAARRRVRDNPNDEAAVLDLARLLVVLEFRRDALDVLLEGSERIPHAMRIEKQVLELFDRLADEHGRETYLAKRIQAFPKRADLVFRHVRSLYLLRRRAEAAAELDRVTADLTPPERFARYLEMARSLRREGLTTGAAGLFEKLVEWTPARLDVRRELAETYLALGDRRRARKLFAADLARDTDVENVLDVVPFM
ncbi:MAG: hypothetical protein AMK75_03810, partial [Planctomycetes bacterium SM23_65]